MRKVSHSMSIVVSYTHWDIRLGIEMLVPISSEEPLLLIVIIGGVLTLALWSSGVILVQEDLNENLNWHV